MAKKAANSNKAAGKGFDVAQGRPSALVDIRVIYCGDNLDQLKKFPNECVDLIYIDPPFNSNCKSWGAKHRVFSFDLQLRR